MRPHAPRLKKFRATPEASSHAVLGARAKATAAAVMHENIRELNRYITRNSKSLEFSIPDIAIKRNDNSEIRDKIMSIDPEKRKELKINKSTLWYQQKKIKEAKTIKIYNKTKVKIK